MKYAVDLDQRQYAVLCSDAILLSARGRHEVWSARSFGSHWRLYTADAEAAEMRDVFRIRGMADGVMAIDAALAAPAERAARAGRLRRSGLAGA